MKYCVQLSTGLIFQSNTEWTYTEINYAVPKGVEDKSTPIDGHIFVNNTWTPVNDFTWKGSSVIAEWTE